MRTLRPGGQIFLGIRVEQVSQDSNPSPQDHALWSWPWITQLTLFLTNHTTQIGSLPSSSCMKSTEVMSHKHHRRHTDAWTDQGGKTSRAEQWQGEFTSPRSGTLSPHGAPDLCASAVPTSLRFCPGSLAIYSHFVSHCLALKDGFR